MIQRIRQSMPAYARIHLGLFALLWIWIAASPCMMALAQTPAPMPEPMHKDCPDCPPKPCHELEPEECQVLDSLDLPRADTSSDSIAWLPPVLASALTFDRSVIERSIVYRQPPARAGPALYLLNVRFKE